MRNTKKSAPGASDRRYYPSMTSGMLMGLNAAVARLGEKGEKMRLMKAICAALPITLAGCTAMTTISATQPNTTVEIANSPNSAAPRTETFYARSFGNFEFRAESPGHEPFYGILPLKFNGGYLALDILFFAPATFFNLREVYPYYEFDLEKKHVRYRKKPEDEWEIFVPNESDVRQGKAVLAPR